jgi:hypothetical protein
MTIQKLQIRGTEMNKMQFSEIEDYLQEKGINVNEAFDLMADGKEFVYVSNGFITGLKNEETQPFEWHHFFKKQEDGTFEAGKLQFN